MILSRVENSVREYASEYPWIDYKGIVNRFGTPQHIAESCIAEMEPADLLEGMQIRQKILLAVAGAAVLLVLIRFGFNLASYQSFEKDINGYAVVEVIEITRETFAEGESE